MTRNPNYFSEFQDKLRHAKVAETAIRAFKYKYDNLVAGQTGLISEASIQPVTQLPRYEELARQTRPNAQLLAQTVLVKLNGGLGTSMGLERAKSLLPVRNGLCFLDFIVRQVLYLREQHQVRLHFLLMNSFSTRGDTLAFLKRYPRLGPPEDLELMQSQVPKVDAATFRPVSWPQNPQLEWCPPGHGDFYPSFAGSGWLERLLTTGVNYLFVSNSDNLGASLDLTLLTWFAASGKPFLMEVAERTGSDRKGGHLAARAGTLLLRESAQCLESDQAAFQDLQRHRFFNTNNLWIRLDAIKTLAEAHDGFVPLPLIKNSKTVDPRDKNSPRVFQLETAMGAAIEAFPGAGAIVVPRSRFAPVKTCAELMGLRSDAYEVKADWQVAPAHDGSGQPPAIDLDAEHYRLVEQLDEKLAGGVPSLKDCRELVVRGPVSFEAGNVFKGSVRLNNGSGSLRRLPAGEYGDRVVEL
jgi:UDP-N-acetylglucosamine pyrophosphorylase